MDELIGYQDLREWLESQRKSTRGIHQYRYEQLIKILELCAKMSVAEDREFYSYLIEEELR